MKRKVLDCDESHLSDKQWFAQAQSVDLVYPSTHSLTRYTPTDSGAEEEVKDVSPQGAKHRLN